MPKKKTKVNLGMKNLAMFSSYFNFIFVHLRQKARLRPELSTKFINFRPEPGLNSALNRTQPEKPGPT